VTQKVAETPLITDNRAQTTSLVESIKHLLKHSSEGKFALGYFYLGGYNLVKDEFANLKKAKIIMGDETTEATVQEIVKALASKGGQRADDESVLHEFKERIANDLSTIEDFEQKKRISDLHELIENGVVEVRVYPKGKFHPKLYLFLRDGDRGHVGIVGSSNFTKPGLEENVELNLRVSEQSVINELDRWFEDVWMLSKDFNKDLVHVIESSGIPEEVREGAERVAVRWGTYLSPKDLFKILAYEILDGRVDLTRERRILTLFQEIGVLNSATKMKKFFGSLVADSVGLGKSFIGSQVLKDYMYGKVDFWDDRLGQKWEEKGRAVLLIVPAHLRRQWRDDVLSTYFFTNCVIKPIDGEYYFGLVDKTQGHLGRVRIVSYSKFTRLSKETLKAFSDEFDVILIDEAHRFRDDKTAAWHNVQELKKKSSYTVDVAGVSEGIRNRFILLSATPLNNRISDVINIFKTFLDRDLRDLARQGKNVTLFEQYEEAKEQLKEAPSNRELRERLARIVKQIKNELLDDLMLLRTRVYIKEHYKDTRINGKPLVFKDPIVKPVRYDQNLKSYYDEYLALYEGLSTFLEKLEYPYLDLFLVEERRKGNLRALLKILLLKRIESSIYSFVKSINRMKEKEAFVLELLGKFKDHSRIRVEWERRFGKRSEDEVDEDEELGIEFSEAVEGEQEEGEKELPALDIEALIDKARSDLRLINEYLKKIEKVRNQDHSDKFKDPKLDSIKTALNDLIQNASEMPRILVFTQFKDTANYLFTEIKEWVSKQSAPSFRKLKMELVTGDTDMDVKERIVKRFAPVANDYTLKEGEEIHILISTDALSEGVNLQDASIVINYDLPWNPMRIVQRVGRVNRIGSENQIYTYNFFPHRDLEELLKLLSILWDKIEDVKNLLAKEMQILSEEEEVTIDTIGETIRGIRQQTDINKLEANARSQDFKVADVYGEDEESKQKLEIIAKLMELGVSEKEMTSLAEMANKHPYYTIIGNGEIVRLYRIFDKVRNEKMRNYVVRYDRNRCELAPVAAINVLAAREDSKSVIDLSEEDRADLKKQILEIDQRFSDTILEEYKKLFTSYRQGLIQQFSGIHRKVVKYLRTLNTQKTLFWDNIDLELLARTRQIYESMSLRPNEVKALKEHFANEGIDLERGGLRKQEPAKILLLLDSFYRNFLLAQPDTYFGGIRTDKHLDYMSIGWYA